MSNDNNTIKTEYCIIKQKFFIEDYDKNLSISLDKKNGAIIKNMSIYFNKKVTFPIKEMSLAINSNYNKSTFKDPLNEIFEMKNKVPKTQNNLNLNTNSNAINKKINLNQLLLNESKKSY